MSTGPGAGARGAAPPRRPKRTRRWRAAVTSLVVVGVVVIVVIAVSGSKSLPKPPPASTAQPIAGNVFGYDSSREAQFVARATAGNAHALFVKSPGGVLATASRVAAYRPLIDRVTAGTGIDPNLLEGLVFVESAGRPDAIAGTDVADAVGLTQILAETGQSLLGMHINLPESRKLTRQIYALAPTAQHAVYGFLLARRQAADPRFSPAAALAAAVRYLKIAQRQFGREDLAFESYHMGIGNLHQVLEDYDGGASVPYAQLYFDVAPTRHASAYRLLQSFGDDSSLYYWRLLGAVSIMHLWRTDRTALRRLVSLQTADDAGAAALGPPQTVSSYADASALAAAYQHKGLVPLPANAAQLGLAVNPQMGAGAAKGAPPSLYRGLRPPALHMLIEIGSGVRSLSRVAAPLHVYSTVADTRYLEAQNALYPPATSGYSFAITRRYAGRGAQATAFQEMLDRLQSLDLIAWAREPSTIEITAAPDAAEWRP